MASQVLAQFSNFFAWPQGHRPFTFSTVCTFMHSTFRTFSPKSAPDAAPKNNSPPLFRKWNTLCHPILLYDHRNPPRSQKTKYPFPSLKTDRLPPFSLLKTESDDAIGADSVLCERQASGRCTICGFDIVSVNCYSLQGHSVERFLLFSPAFEQLIPKGLFPAGAFIERFSFSNMSIT